MWIGWLLLVHPIPWLWFAFSVFFSFRSFTHHPSCLHPDAMIWPPWTDLGVSRSSVPHCTWKGSAGVVHQFLWRGYRTPHPRGVLIQAWSSPQGMEAALVRPGFHEAPSKWLLSFSERALRAPSQAPICLPAEVLWLEGGCKLQRVHRPGRSGLCWGYWERSGGT